MFITIRSSFTRCNYGQVFTCFSNHNICEVSEIMTDLALSYNTDLLMKNFKSQVCFLGPHSML